ncbi:MAG: hypothetical protein IJ088_13365 [Clostridia bacterium]|nr:hypothetical protein [Clostridia bacterium]
MKLNSWKISLHAEMPQKIATAMAELGDRMLGTEYRAISYLGSQEVNGTNHAVLAEQTVLTGRDTRNVVILIFNEKPNEMTATLVGIERVVEGGMPLGGTNIEILTDLPEAVRNVWAAAFDGFVGSEVTPIALLATRPANGYLYIFAAIVTPIAPNAEQYAAIVIIDPRNERISMKSLLNTRAEGAFGYSFTW